MAAISPEYNTNYSRLQDANLVGDLKSVAILGELHERLLESVGADQSVDTDNLNIIQAGNSGLNLALVGAEVNNEHKGVVVLDLLHGSFRGQGLLDHGELVHLGDRLLCRGSVLGLPGELEGLGPVELHTGPHLVGLLVGLGEGGRGGLGGLLGRGRSLSVLLC